MRVARRSRDHLTGAAAEGASLGPPCASLRTRRSRPHGRGGRTARRVPAGPFAEIAAGTACGLHSSENFGRLDAAAISLPRRVLDGHAVEVVYFARRWSGLPPSVWQESVKRGNTETLSAFTFGHLLRPFRSDVLNDANVLAGMRRRSVRMCCALPLTTRCWRTAGRCWVSFSTESSAYRCRWRMLRSSAY